jgi:hypothetical protein
MSRVWNDIKMNICKGCGNDIQSFGFRTFLFGKKEIEQIRKNKDSVLKLLLGDTHEES